MIDFANDMYKPLYYNFEAVGIGIGSMGAILFKVRVFLNGTGRGSLQSIQCGRPGMHSQGKNRRTILVWK